MIRPESRSGAERPNPAQLLAGKAGAEHQVSQKILRSCLSHRLGLDAKVAQNFHCALVGEMRAGGIGEPAVFGHDDIRHTIRAQGEGGR